VSLLTKIKSFREIITSISLEIREIIIESKNTLSITQGIGSGKRRKN
jgi:hypothetical protein